MNQELPPFLRNCDRSLVMAAVLSLLPCLVVAADAPATSPARQSSTAERKEKPVSGTFVAFEDRVLVLENRGLIRVTIPENAETVMWNHDEGRSKPVDTGEAMTRLKEMVAPPDSVAAAKPDTAESMSWRKAGTWLTVQPAGDKVTIRVGEKKDPFTGNFISFKDDFVCLRLNKPHRQFRQIYGDILKLRMNEHIPVYESIDGGEYQRAGSPRSVLGAVKEGTVVTVYHNYITETDEFYLVLLGVKQK
jgi:hypothetical protein